MKNKSTIIQLVSAAALLACLPAIAKDKKGLASPKAAAAAAPVSQPNEAVGQPSRPVTGKEPWIKVGWQFSDQERNTITDYVDNYGGKGKARGKNRSLPPGLAKKVARGESLPPGWQKKCVVGERMPPEVYEQCRPLPPDLAVKLPPPPEPVITVAVGGKIVRLLEATRQILDVFDVHVRF